MLGRTLRALLNEHDMTTQQLAEKAGLPLESVRNIYYDRVKDPKTSTLMSISKVLNVSVNYLMGESLYTKDEVALVRHYRKCGAHGKSVIRFIARYEAATAKKEKDGQKRRVHCLIPPEKTKDGFVYLSSDADVVEIETDIPEAYMALEITSNVYAPLICKGDRVLLADRYPEHRERAVFIMGGKAYFRQLIELENKRVLKSINNKSTDIVLMHLNEVECLGTWVGVIRS